MAHLRLEKVKSIPQTHADCVRGYLRNCEKDLSLSSRIDELIGATILLLYYHGIESTILTVCEMESQHCGGQSGLGPVVQSKRTWIPRNELL